MWGRGQIIKHQRTGKLAVYGGFYYNEETGISHVEAYIPKRISISTRDWKEVVLLDKNPTDRTTMLFVSHIKYDNMDFEESLEEAAKLQTTSDYEYKEPIQTKYV